MKRPSQSYNLLLLDAMVLSLHDTLVLSLLGIVLFGTVVLSLLDTALFYAMVLSLLDAVVLSLLGAMVLSVVLFDAGCGEAVAGGREVPEAPSHGSVPQTCARYRNQAVHGRCVSTL